MIGKGGGSAYGGKWRPNPNKPQDQRYLGNPGEIKRTIMNNGDVYKTKMGPDGRAEMERHETNHNRGDKHTNPHDHRISSVSYTHLKMFRIAHIDYHFYLKYLLKKCKILIKSIKRLEA